MRRVDDQHLDFTARMSGAVWLAKAEEWLRKTCVLLSDGLDETTLRCPRKHALKGANMKQQIKTLCAGGLLALALFGPAMAGPLEDGQAAFWKRNFATAL